MNRPMYRASLGMIIAVMLAACNRHVVIEPEMVDSRNQADWTIVSAPAATLPPPPPPPPPSATTSDIP